MTMECTETTIEILGRQFIIKCPPSEIPALQKAATLMEEKMKHLRSKSMYFNFDNAAVIVALNLANELLTSQSQKDSRLHEVHQRLNEMHSQIELALANHEQNTLP